MQGDAAVVIMGKEEVHSWWGFDWSLNNFYNSSIQK